MDGLLVGLRLVHVLAGISWAGSLFFFIAFLDPALKSLGPDGGKVMIKLFERGYLTILPLIALLTIISGTWLLWIASSGFNPAWMGSRYGIALSTGGSLAIAGFAVGMLVVRRVGKRVWAIARELPGITDEGTRTSRLAEMQALRIRAGVSARIVFVLVAVAAALMAVGRYLG